MHDDAHDQVLVAFNIWDVTVGWRAAEDRECGGETGH
jgi:hypothetical protein